MVKVFYPKPYHTFYPHHFAPSTWLIYRYLYGECPLEAEYLPYILPSSERMILRLPHGGYMASASWKPSTYHTFYPHLRGWFCACHTVGIWRVPLGSSVRCLDSRPPQHRFPVRHCCCSRDCRGPPWVCLDPGYLGWSRWKTCLSLTWNGPHTVIVLSFQALTRNLDYS